MLWLAFVALPLLFATLVYAAGAVRLPMAFVFGIAGSSVALECVLLASAIGTWTWSNVLSVCVLLVALPWVAALVFAWYIPLGRRAPRWSVAVPLVYGVFFVLGAALGDVTGWIPK